MPKRDQGRQIQTAEAAPTDLVDQLVRAIKDAATAYLKQEGIATDLERLPFDLRPSAQEDFGDYSMPLMPWAAKDRVGRPPTVIAEGVATTLEALRMPLVAEATATLPGFLNIRVNRTEAARALLEGILSAGDGFGRGNVGAGVKVVVEHTNINSNKAAHVGHLRNACLGDTVVRMLRAQGYAVETQNYIDDTGVQVADVVVGQTLLQSSRLTLPGGDKQRKAESFDYYCSRLYVAVGKAYDQAKTEQDDAYRRWGAEEDVPQKERPPTPLDQLRRAVLRGIEHGGPLEDGRSNYAAMAADLSQKIVHAHLKTMARLNVSYDLLTWESAILRAGLWRRTFEMLRESGILRFSEEGFTKGCWILPFGEGEVQTEEGDRSSDKILVKSDGTATYTAKDIAYQLWKFGLADDPRVGVRFQFVRWGAQHDGEILWTMRAPQDVLEGLEMSADPKQFGHARRVINVIDVRQSYPQQVVYESLRRLGYVEQADQSKHLDYEVVALSPASAASLGVDTSDGRAFYAMSGRKGIEIKADDLINAAEAKMREAKPELPAETAAVLAASAIRYFMVRFDLHQLIVLDVDEVLRTNGDTGVYLQYACARAHSILRRLRESGYEAPTSVASAPPTLAPSEWSLVRHLDAYPRALAEATAALEPHQFAAYVYELAGRFNDFYDHTPPIIHELDDGVKTFRAALVRATMQTLTNALRVLGFVPLERI